MLVIAHSPVQQASGGIQFLAGLLIVVPVAGLVYFWRRGLLIHFENPAINLLVHSLIIIVPLAWAALIWSQPFEAKPSEEVHLCQTTYFSALEADWWTSLMMWACPVFALVALAYVAATRYFPNPEQLSITPEMALITIGFIFLLAMLYGTMLFGPTETRVSDAGLRNGTLHFYEWENIDHLDRTGDIYSIYHKANPALPASSFRLRSAETRAIVERFATDHKVAITAMPRSHLRTVKTMALVGFGLNLLVSTLLLNVTQLDLRWIIAISFGIGLLFTLLLERMRGVSKYSKLKPKIEPAP